MKRSFLYGSILFMALIILTIVGLALWTKIVHGDDGRISYLYTTTFENDNITGSYGSLPFREIKDNHLHVICFIIGYYGSSAGTSISCLTEKEIKERMK